VLNIMEQFDKQGGFSHAFLTTYEFSPGFFEDRVLKTKAFKSCPYIVILIDEGKYQEICHDPKGGRLINRRYMLMVPFWQRSRRVVRWKFQPDPFWCNQQL